ncbi:thiolase family protein [Pseudovibrio exalbescens]|uniref:Acetyl-CoA acetyltransferase n=1 Tax=Pseudovibrio exalbescens TaxID=197461 RepID=A0A1U7JGM6_9HYPH|nr:beta-ketoacyl synthase N-terminal-like domain-containing protein [Pseudovibrio exalbescens]OKL43900.1 hypothetical protein A3843_09860 [Pseudovibrio exalbescens]
MTTAAVVSARRSSVQPRGGVYAKLQVWELWAPVAQAALADAGVAACDVDRVILGNGLYGGGNPARLCALAAGLPDHVAAMTVDTQCCAGLDSVMLAVSLVESGAADVVLCGGVESFSRRPLRAHRDQGGELAFYERPPFSPDPARDPDPAQANAVLADFCRITPAEQNDWAVDSHRKALAAHEAGRQAAELVAVTLDDPRRDGFMRKLSPAVAERAPVLARHGDGVVTRATTAVEADAAAALVVRRVEAEKGHGLRVQACSQQGSDPAQPGLAPVAALKDMQRRHALDYGCLSVVEMMEAYAVQALACLAPFNFAPGAINRGGGALARGHPIGASGAILMVRLFHELAREPVGARGLAAIAAAGGLSTAVVAQKLG